MSTIPMPSVLVRRVEHTALVPPGQVAVIDGVAHALSIPVLFPDDLVAVIPRGLTLPAWLAAKMGRRDTLDGPAVLPLAYREFDVSEIFGSDAKDGGWVLETPRELNGHPGFVVYEGLDVAGLLGFGRSDLQEVA